MGYTHYWRVKGKPSPSSKGWAVALGEMARIIEDSKAILAGGDGKGSPEVSGTEVVFNGKGDQAHETFDFPGEVGFNFTKTARKPYDKVVVACLLAARANIPETALQISSDGGWSDWKEGRDLYKRVIGREPVAPKEVKDAPEEELIVPSKRVKKQLRVGICPFLTSGSVAQMRTHGNDFDELTIECVRDECEVWDDARQTCGATSVRSEKLGAPESYECGCGHSAPEGEPRYVKGSRTGQWHEIHPGDRDYERWGMTKEQMEKAGAPDYPDPNREWLRMIEREEEQFPGLPAPPAREPPLPPSPPYPRIGEPEGAAQSGMRRYGSILKDETMIGIVLPLSVLIGGTFFIMRLLRK